TKYQLQQEALYQSEKLAAMGSLLSSVAHELNNPLAVVLMHAALLRDELGHSPLLELIDEVTRAAERCKRLVHAFLTLARQHTPQRTAGPRSPPPPRGGGRACPPNPLTPKRVKISSLCATGGQYYRAPGAGREAPTSM